MGTVRTVVVVTGGDPIDAGLVGALPPAVAVIAADSGAEHAVSIGLRVDLAVGDFDSVAPETLRLLEASGTSIERHPAAKDATDLEIGLVAARRFDATDVIVLGGHGGRIDHFIANALLLASPDFADLRIVAMVGPARLTVIHHRAELNGSRGDLVSLLPVAGAVRGVHTDGLLYPLRGEDLTPGSTRGVSNEFAAPQARVSVNDGVLLVVQPGAKGTHLRAGIAPDRAVTSLTSSPPKGTHDA